MQLCPLSSWFSFLEALFFYLAPYYYLSPALTRWENTCSVRAPLREQSRKNEQNGWVMDNSHYFLFHLRNNILFLYTIDNKDLRFFSEQSGGVRDLLMKLALTQWWQCNLLQTWHPAVKCICLTHTLTHSTAGYTLTLLWCSGPQHQRSKNKCKSSLPL